MNRLKALWANEIAEALRAAGDRARDERRWLEATSPYQRYLELHPEDAAIWVQLGHCRKELGDRTGAEKCYLRALSLEPRNPDTLVQLGHVEKLSGRLDHALTWYRKSLALDPGHAPAAIEIEQIEDRMRSSKARAEASGSGEMAEMEGRIQLLAQQVTAIKAVAVELQRVRSSVERLDAQSNELQASVKALELSRSAVAEEHARRLSALETKAATPAIAFPALLSHLTDVRKLREEVVRCQARIHALEWRVEGRD